jgi:hypothetical protein
MKTKTWNRIRRKEKVWYRLIANHIFEDFLFKRRLDETVDRIKRYSSELKKYRAYLEEHQRNIFKRAGWNDYGPDLRSGDETYGYKSRKQVSERLDYISDRFGASFKITWMLELPDRLSSLPEKTAEEIKEEQEENE